MTTKIDSKELKFEQALKKLEAIAEKMTAETSDLDELLHLYEEGVVYLKICREKLAEAELKVKVINEKMNIEMPEEEENG